MNKKLYMIVLLVISTSTLFAQQVKKASPSTNVYQQLTEDKKLSIKNIHEKYRKAIQDLLKNTEDPIVRREKAYQLQISRDSSLKVVLGEQLYKQYRISGSAALPTKRVSGKGEAKLIRKNDELAELPIIKQNLEEVQRLDEPVLLRP